MNQNLEIIKLEIEGCFLQCNRNQLIQNSVYFETMLSGNFVESNLKTVKLEGVDLEAMKLILQQLKCSSKEFSLKTEQILMVLQTAQMLQFENILKLTIQHIYSVLSATNCINIWFFAEQLSIHPLYLKAKSIALTEFITIKGNGSLMDLNMNQICTYLGNRALKTNSESEVFEVIMQWWRHNSASIPIKKNESSSDNDETLEEQMALLISCIDFQRSNYDDFKTMSTLVALSHNKFAIDLIHCVFALKTGHSRKDLHKKNKTIFKYAQCLLDSKPRKLPLLPCITAKIEVQRDLQAPPSEKRIKISENSTDILIFDDITKDLEVLLHIAPPPILAFEKLDGYKIYGYKNRFFIIGGEYVTGSWNESIWSYNFIEEKWQRIQTMSEARRHFKLCRVNNELFIIGGTGPLVFLRSMIAFSLEDYTWSSNVSLPSSIFCYMNMECCEHNGNLLLLPRDINAHRHGYLYNHSIKWTALIITDPMRRVIKFPEQYVVYSYKNKVYIKGDCVLIQMRIQDCDLIVDEIRTINTTFDNHVEQAVMCGNILYTFGKYTYIGADSEFYTVKQFNVETYMEEILHDIPINEHGYNLNIVAGCFAFMYYNRLKKNEIVNEKYLDSIKKMKQKSDS